FGKDLPHPELFPSRDEFVAHGPYFGPPLSYGQYLFVIHSATDFLGGTIAGFPEVLANTGGFYVPGVCRILGPFPAVAEIVTSLFGGIDQIARSLIVLGLGGLIVSAWRRRQLSDLLIPSMVITGLAFSTFLYHLH